MRAVALFSLLLCASISPATSAPDQEGAISTARQAFQYQAQDGTLRC